MNKPNPTYAELKAENAQLQRQVAELEDLVRGLTQQVAEVLRASGQQRSSPFSPGEPKTDPEKPGHKKGCKRSAISV